MTRARQSAFVSSGAFGALVLNCWLFVPSYVCSVPSADFWPFFPKLQGIHFDLRGIYHYLLSLVLRRDNQDVFRGSIDFAVLLLLLVWTARTPLRGLVRALCVTCFGLLWLFLAYHHGVEHFFMRPAALGEDLQLGLALFHFIGSFGRASWFADLFGVLFAVFLLRLAAHSFRALQLTAAQWNLRAHLIFAAALIVPSIASLAWFGVQRDDPVLQLTTKRVLYNYRASVAEAQRRRDFESTPPDLRYDVFSRIKLMHKPAFYLIMVEAYGAVLATSDMDAAYRAVLARAEQRLSAIGLHARTAYSAAPVHGGTSWLSISTVHTGVLIDRPHAYKVFESVGSRAPMLTRFFREQGYRTFSLQPGTADRPGLRRSDVYQHDVPVDGPRIAYPGKRFGWGRVPDQYSLSVFSKHFLDHGDVPRYVFYMGVSTHFPWGDGVPPYVRDLRRLEESARKPLRPEDTDNSWSEIPEADRIGTPYRRSYFRSVAYEWRVLTEWFEREATRDSVIVIIGDHQPRLESDVPGGSTMNTPVHVLAHDAAFVERFAEQGFQPGLYADPTLHPPLSHAGLFSLILSKLGAAYGDEQSRDLPYFPTGLPLAALNR